MSPRGGGRGPQVLGRRPPAHAGWSPSSHCGVPSPPAAAGGPLMASEHLPDTRGAPSRLLRPQDPRGPATVPRSQAGQRPSHSPWTSRRGVVASTPQRLPLSILPKRQGQIKKKTQGDKWRGAGRGGGDEGLRIALVAAPLLRAGDYMRARGSEGRVKKKKGKKPQEHRIKEGK